MFPCSQHCCVALSLGSHVRCAPLAQPEFCRDSELHRRAPECQGAGRCWLPPGRDRACVDTTGGQLWAPPGTRVEEEDSGSSQHSGAGG